MKENKFTELVTFLVANVVSTEVKSINDGIVIIFIDAEKNIEICKNVMLGVNDIKTVQGALTYLCKFPECIKIIKNDILKYRLNHESMYLLTHSDIAWIFSKYDEECCKHILIKILNSIFGHLSYIDNKPHNPNVDYIEFVLTKLTREDILKQLAEEASEVANVGNNISMSASFIAQYALKDIRATCNTVNMTPEPIENIKKELNGNVEILNTVRTKELEEECGDLNMCLDLLHHLDGDHPIEEFNTLDNPKWKRWAERLGFISF